MAMNRLPHNDTLTTKISFQLALAVLLLPVCVMYSFMAMDFFWSRFTLVAFVHDQGLPAMLLYGGVCSAVGWLLLSATELLHRRQKSSALPCPAGPLWQMILLYAFAAGAAYFLYIVSFIFMFD